MLPGTVAATWREALELDTDQRAEPPNGGEERDWMKEEEEVKGGIESEKECAATKIEDGTRMDNAATRMTCHHVTLHAQVVMVDMVELTCLRHLPHFPSTPYEANDEKWSKLSFVGVSCSGCECECCSQHWTALAL